MKSDNNPSVIFGLYTKPEKYAELLDELINKRGLGVREIRFIDVEIPLDRYDETINFFKEFIMLDFWNGKNPLTKEFPKIFGFDLKKKMLDAIEQHSHYKPVDLTNADWKPHQRHKLLWTLAVPLFYQDTSFACSTAEEKDKFKKLSEFKTENYDNDVEKEIKKVWSDIDKEVEEKKR